MKNVELHPFVFIYLARLYMYTEIPNIKEAVKSSSMRETNQTSIMFEDWLNKSMQGNNIPITEAIGNTLELLNLDLKEFSELKDRAKIHGYKLVKF